MNTSTLPLITISEINQYLGQDQDQPFIIARPGEKEAELNLFDYPARFEGGAFVICTRGSATVSINLTRYEVKAGYMLLVPSNTILQMHDRSDHFKSYMIGFSASLFDGIQLRSVIPLIAEIVETPLFELSEEDARILLKDCIFIHEKAKIPDHSFRKEVMQHLMLALFYDVCYYFEKKRPQTIRPRTHSDEILEKFGRLVAFNYKTERNVDFYANELCLTPKYLSTIIKKSSGRSVPEWIRLALIMDAKVKLKHSSLTVQQISDELNFPNPSFFGRFFKKHTGMTPLEYRMS